MKHWTENKYIFSAALLGCVALAGITFIIGKELLEGELGVSLTDPRWVSDPHEPGSFIAEKPNGIAALLALVSAGVGGGAMYLVALRPLMKSRND